MLMIGGVMAFSVTSLGGGRYLLNLSNNRSAIAYNISYDKQSDVATMNINSSDHKGLTMKDITDARAYVATLNGRANKMGKTTIHIN
jgi:hypothetical protein